MFKVEFLGMFKKAFTGDHTTPLNKSGKNVDYCNINSKNKC